ncbi:MAG: NAD(P)-dependent oxidoreductase [Bacteroidales bacterium]|jgi:nucleoside-diphosphate-sugar epimerase
MEKLKILITGGNGFLGVNIINALLKNKFDVVVLEKNRNFTSKLSHFTNDIKIFFSDDNDLEEIFRTNNIHSILHCATNYGKSGLNSEVIETNILMPIKLLELCKKYEVKYYINTDTFYNKVGNEDYTFLREYIKSKKHICDWLKLSSYNEIRILNMKLEHIYGPDDNADKFVPMIIKKLMNNEKEINLTFGEQKRDFIFVDDVVSAFIFAINNIDKFHTGYNELSVGTSKVITIKEFVMTAKNIIDSKSILNFGKLPYRDNEIMFSSAKLSSLQENGWKSIISLKEGLKKIIEFEKNRQNELIKTDNKF